MGRTADFLSSLLYNFAVTFGGKRDLATVLGYKPVLEYHDYLARFARGDIAGRIVEIPAEATWKTLPRLTEDDKLKGETALSRKFAKLAKRVKLRQMLEKADVLAGIGRYSVLLIGFNDGRKLEEPVAPGSDVLFVQPFSEDNAQPATIDLDPSSPGFGQPSHYTIDLSRGLSEANPTLAGILGRVRRALGPTVPRVHVSRLVHIAEGTLEDNLYGRPRLRRVWDRLDDLAKIAGGSAETFWLIANRGMQFDVDKDLALTDEDKAELLEQQEQYEHGQSRWFRTRGVTIKGLNELGAGNVNPSQVFRVIAALIVGATDIPYRMLFGTERGQNINAQDRRAWLEQVSSRQGSFASEVVLQPLIERLVAAGALPALALEASLVWPPVHDDKHQAEVAKDVATAEKAHAQAVQAGGHVLTTGEFRSKFLGLPSEMPKDAQDEERKAEAEQAAADAAAAAADAAQQQSEDLPNAA